MATAPATIRAILFDLGNTLWERTDADALQREERAADLTAGAVLRGLLSTQGSIPPDWDDFTRGHTLRERFFAGVYAAHDADPQREPVWADLAMRVLRGLGYAEADERWGSILYEAVRVRSLRSRVLFPDALTTLATLAGRGYALGVVTDRAFGGSVFLADLREMDLAPCFAPEAIAVSADLGYRKPHPAMFLHAAHALGIAPDQCAMVGDSLRADIAGAKSLGMFAIWRPYPNRDEAEARLADLTDRPKPDATIATTADLLDLFPERQGTQCRQG